MIDLPAMQSTTALDDLKAKIEARTIARIQQLQDETKEVLASAQSNLERVRESKASGGAIIIEGEGFYVNHISKVNKIARLLGAKMDRIKTGQWLSHVGNSAQKKEEDAKAAAAKKAADEKLAADERLVSEAKAVAEKKEADAKAAVEKKEESDAKAAAAAKKAADEKLAAQKKAADEKKANETKVAYEKQVGKASKRIAGFFRKIRMVAKFTAMRVSIIDRIRKLKALNVMAVKELGDGASGVELDLGKGKVILRQKILFKPKTHIIKKASLGYVEEIAVVLSTIAKIIKNEGSSLQLDQIQYVVNGHTHASAGKNPLAPKAVAQSYKRANSVKEHLIASGVDARTLFANGFGGSVPLGGTPGADRRVEICVVTPARAAHLKTIAKKRKEETSAASK